MDQHKAFDEWATHQAQAPEEWVSRVTTGLQQMFDHLAQECQRVIREQTALIVAFEAAHRDRLLAERMVRETVQQLLRERENARVLREKFGFEL